MTTIQQSTEPINWEVDKKIPQTINVLTILTLIASGLEVLYTIWGMFKGGPTEAELQNIQDKYDKSPDLVKSMMGPNAVEMARRTAENRVSLLILGLVAVGLCIYGALQMRKLKKQGFYIYLIGELVVPLIAMCVIIGLSYYTTFTLTISLIVPVLFIILYAAQLKKMS